MNIVEPDGPEDIANRLCGRIIIPITDGLGPIDGKDYFFRDFGYQGGLQVSAALMIEGLYVTETEYEESQIAEMVENLRKHDDPHGIGYDYLIPIRAKAADMIEQLWDARKTSKPNTDSE